MRPGDRVALLRKLADRLAGADFSLPELDLVLRQFGFPTDRYTAANTTSAYALAQLEDGPDEALVDLDEYLFAGASRDNLDLADLPWESGTFRLFISHTHAHAALAGGMRDVFARWRMDAFVAHVDIEPTREWEHVIESALSTCDALAALITDDFLGSSWCDQEVGYCLARRVPIVPVKLGPDPHGFIGKYQAATARHPDRPPWVADAVFHALARHAAIKNIMAVPVVHRYATSTNWDGARVNFGLLTEVPADPSRQTPL